VEYDHSSGSHIILEMFIAQPEDDAAPRTEFNDDRVVWVDYAEGLQTDSAMKMSDSTTQVSKR